MTELCRRTGCCAYYQYGITNCENEQEGKEHTPCLEPHYRHPYSTFLGLNQYWGGAMSPTTDAKDIDELTSSAEYLRLQSRTTDYRLTDAGRQEAITTLDALSSRFALARIPAGWDTTQAVYSLRANRAEDRLYVDTS